MPGGKDMKFKLLLLPVTLFALAGCKEEPATGLPDFVGDIATLKSKNTSLTSSDSTASEIVTLNVPNSEKTYQVEISAGCKLNTKGAAPQIQLNPGCYIKSVSGFTVDRLVIDYYASKGTFYTVYNNKEGTGEHVKDFEAPKAVAIDSDGGGAVLQFPINSTSWIIKNETEFNKPTFYAIYICLG